MRLAAVIVMLEPIAQNWAKCYKTRKPYDHIFMPHFNVEKIGVCPLSYYFLIPIFPLLMKAIVAIKLQE